MLGAGLQRWMADALIELYRDYRAVTGQEPRTLAHALADPWSRGLPG